MVSLSGGIRRGAGTTSTGTGHSCSPHRTEDLPGATRFRGRFECHLLFPGGMWAQKRDGPCPRQNCAGPRHDGCRNPGTRQPLAPRLRSLCEQKKDVAPAADRGCGGCVGFAWAGAGGVGVCYGEQRGSYLLRKHRRDRKISWLHQGVDKGGLFRGFSWWNCWRHFAVGFRDRTRFV